MSLFARGIRFSSADIRVAPALLRSVGDAVPVFVVDAVLGLAFDAAPVLVAGGVAALVFD
jgi:NaMN:DMB phosphoribosyltransferase